MGLETGKTDVTPTVGRSRMFRNSQRKPPERCLRYKTYLYEEGVLSDYRNRFVSVAITGTTITKQSHIEAKRNDHLFDNNNSGSAKNEEHPIDTK